MSLPSGVDLTKPKFDQSTYVNRAKHFFLLTNPLNLLASEKDLDDAKRVISEYKAGKTEIEGCKSVDDLWRAKYLYDSAFHPDTGEKMIMVGRMSAQVPMNTAITGAMLTFYKSTPAVIFWQWLNQSFNALVNFTNRSGSSPIDTKQLLTSYVMATGGALTTALSLNRLTKKMNPLVGRLVPVVAVAAANCINIPMMRIQELKNGISLVDDQYSSLNIASKTAAYQGISAVIVSRILMAMPGMVITPVVVQQLANKGVFQKYPKANAPVQMALVGFILIFATPLGCAFFSQMASIKVDDLEPDVKAVVKKQKPDLEVAWYNKGL